MEAEEKRFLEKIARLDLAGVSVGEIAVVVGNADSYVYELMQKDDYAHIKAGISSLEFEKQELLADAWQSIEAKALAVVNNHLDWNKDPDFALKAAAVANKSDKPGKRFGRQINATQAATATISLTVEFVEKIASKNGHIIDVTPVDDENKINNVLSIGKTEELLAPALAPEAQDQLADKLGTLFEAEAAKQ